MKQGYQPKSCNLKNIVPPSVSTNVKPKKEGYTWEDLNKAWWEGFDTCKAKSGEANIKLNDELEKLKKQFEELPDKWCRNKDDYCPHLAELEKENAELKEEISTKDILIKELQEQKVYWKNSSFDWRHKFFKLDKVKRLVKKDEQLTKAKELLAKWVELFKPKLEGYPITPIQEQTEQFLSEVEK